MSLSLVVNTEWRYGRNWGLGVLLLLLASGLGWLVKKGILSPSEGSLYRVISTASSTNVSTRTWENVPTSGYCGGNGLYRA
ncbi:hypothetical protein QBC47DRAFT_368277 [Echria macrotheca]|uniref:Uncharacterized protein n=1 Tax=Echria macrotheca TaxID=438768 RepID=A0AAJ0BMC2_9PEZI|nr:hypothetical protein QBC47DRAFT_368277 [Echria macrotheca]